MTKSSNMIETDAYYARAYADLSPDRSCVAAFWNTVYDAISSEVQWSPETSILDIGCGRGYFLAKLDRLGFTHLKGIEPCEALRKQGLYKNIVDGTFEHNDCESSQFDMVFTCHTLHHLPDPHPVFALSEMLRITRKYLVIVEINNTNVPVSIICFMNRCLEQNALCYNRKKVVSMLTSLDTRIIASWNLKSAYVSGNSLIHRFAARIGTYPYNITIAEKTT